jgi:hypothetical protein
MAEKGELLPKPTAGIFADTMREPDSVYVWLDWLETQLSYPVYRVSKGDLGADSLRTGVSKKTGKIWQKNLIPAYILGETKGVLRRMCTLDYKIEVVRKKLRELVKPEMKAWKKKHQSALKALRFYDEFKNLTDVQYPYEAWQECQADPLITQWMGISADEAVRAKESRIPYIKDIHPLLDANMTREDCYKWMRSHGYPDPPRSACYFCPYHSDAEWIRLRDQEPNEFAKAVDYERQLQAGFDRQQTLLGRPFLHNARIPLDQVVFDPNKGKHNFGNECEGMCGV